ncbi:MAG: DUF599 family protein [Azospirillum sp.]|nr:DUF599 family protein [Azospirillum sp.]
MPLDITALDFGAVVWFLAVWSLYTLVQDRLLAGPVGVNQYLKQIRRVWMHRMLGRENRIVDSQLIGHTMHSVTFFASTTMLVIAGLVGAIGAGERIHALVVELSFAVTTSRQFFEAKLLFLLGIFVYSFFNFTWALRQFNYCCAMVGSAPMPPVAAALRDRLTCQIASTLTLGITSFNRGLRSYYFALAALTWFIHPILFLIAPNLIVLMLVRRQLWSHTHSAIKAQAELLAEIEREGEGPAATARDS